MIPISPEKLIEVGFSFLEVNKYYKIEVGRIAFGVVQKGGTWMYSPLPMQFASLVSVSTIEDIDKLLFADSGHRLLSLPQ
jgi:hypothetical protein